MSQPSILREAFQKKPLNPWKCSYLGGGGSPSQRSHLLIGFFLHAPNLLVWLYAAPKQILCSLLNSIFHIFSDLFTIKINLLPINKFWRPSFALFWTKMLQNLFHSVPNNPNNPKRHCAHSRWGGVRGRYEHAHGFNSFFLSLPLVSTWTLRVARDGSSTWWTLRSLGCDIFLQGVWLMSVVFGRPLYRGQTMAWPWSLPARQCQSADQAPKTSPRGKPLFTDPV